MARKASRTLCEQSHPLTRERVDRTAGVIYGVKVCGLRSKNGRTYTPEALKKAISLYEGASVNIDHSTAEGESVKADRRFGQLQGIRWAESPEPGLYGDLHYLTSHPLAARVAEAAERMPTAYGLSHNAYAGDMQPGPDGKPVITSIAEVNSVDLVADPATNAGLFESHQRTTPMKKAVKAILESAALFPIQKAPLKEMVDDPALASALAVEVETPDESTPVDSAKAAFSAMAAHVMAGDSPDKTKTFAALVGHQAKFMGETPGTTSKPDDPPTKTEAVKPIGALGAARLCEQLELKPSVGQLALLAEEPEAKAKLIAEEFARIALTRKEQKPASGAREQLVTESTETKPAASLDEFLAKVK